MKKLISLSLLVVFLFALSGFSCLDLPAKAVTETKPAVSVLETSAPESDVLKVARFENMLNHNFLYDDDFSDMNTVINNSCLALLDKAEDQFISTDLLFPFIENLYGISVFVDDDFNKDFPKKQGAVYVIPRGFTQYTHTVINVKEDGDTLTVTSLALSDGHDSEPVELLCTTVFKINTESAFGYNILSSTLKTANGIDF